MHELLTTQEMAEADRLTVECGTPGLTLMERAGRAVAQEVIWRHPDAERVTVLCGPGNNGGDGFVAARVLAESGFGVRVATLAPVEALKGDAAAMARAWTGETVNLAPSCLDGSDAVIDALFGAGLTRPIAGVAGDVIEALNSRSLSVIAVDVPSGVDGTTGEVKGVAPQADATITFFRRKPGHLLLPGRQLCGAVRIVDIGIPDKVLADISPRTYANAPALWLARYPWPVLEAHKYDRGHAVVISGGAESTGAARLGARAALRAGAGLVTLAGSKASTAVNAAQVTAVMVKSIAGAKGLASFLKDDRRNAVLIGPGAGVTKSTRELVLAALDSGAACVLDADALTSFAKQPKQLFKAIGRRRAPVVLTPHDGEFNRLFGSIAGSRLERARTAARMSGAIVVLKGPDTCVAAPQEVAAINENATAWLATAGSGDVLGGLITGLLAQRVPSFDAACAAVWLHGAAGSRIGPGLIAEDLSEVLPAVLQDLAEMAGR